jgi:hypothetical protein
MPMSEPTLSRMEFVLSSSVLGEGRRGGREEQDREEEQRREFHRSLRWQER